MRLAVVYPPHTEVISLSILIVLLTLKLFLPWCSYGERGEIEVDIVKGWWGREIVEKKYYADEWLRRKTCCGCCSQIADTPANNGDALQVDWQTEDPKKVDLWPFLGVWTNGIVKMSRESWTKSVFFNLRKRWDRYIWWVRKPQDRKRENKGGEWQWPSFRRLMSITDIGRVGGNQFLV